MEYLLLVEGVDFESQPPGPNQSNTTLCHMQSGHVAHSDIFFMFYIKRKVPATERALTSQAWL
jgi:hypothetical protein